MLFGLVLVIIGVLLLLQNIGLIEGNFWNYLWPIIIILLGISILSKKNRKGIDCFGWKMGGKNKHKDHQDHHKIVDEQ